MRGESQRVADRVRELLDPARYSPVPPPTPSDGLFDPEQVTGEESVGSRPGPRDEVEGVVADAAVGRRRAVPWWRQLLARVPVQLDPGRRAVVAVGVAVVVVAVLAAIWLWFAQPRSADVAVRPTPIAGASSPVGTGSAGTPAGRSGVQPSTTTSAPVELVVDVAGKVVHPGLQRLRPGARVADAVAAAGGALPGVDLSSVNLAARVADGQQIAIGVVPAPGAGQTGSVDAAGGSNSSEAVDGGLVNLNSATLEQLQELPGIGPALAQRILDYRSEHGTFHSVDQLNDVSGIGDAKLAALRARATV